MKTIHAYQNADGTYRVESVGFIMDNGELREVSVEIPRAKVIVEALASKDSKEIYSLTVKENE